jgi:hypothetical protein
VASLTLPTPAAIPTSAPHLARPSADRAMSAKSPPSISPHATTSAYSGVTPKHARTTNGH